MKKEDTYIARYIVRDYFQPPMFDWYFDWVCIQITSNNIFNNGGKLPVKRHTQVVWKSKRTGRIKTKIYNYQINHD